MVEKILNGWSRVETVLIGILLIAALVVFLGGAALRYFAPTYAVDWAEEVSIYCIVWATMISGSTLLREGRHINTDMLLAKLPPPASRAVAFAVLLLTLVFCVVMAWYGWQGVRFSLMLDERSASTLRTPMAYALFLALPVGMALMALRLVLMVIAGTRSLTGETQVLAPEELVREASE